MSTLESDITDRCPKCDYAHECDPSRCVEPVGTDLPYVKHKCTNCGESFNYLQALKKAADDQLELKDYHPKVSVLAQDFFKNNPDSRTFEIREKGISFCEKQAKRFLGNGDHIEFANDLRRDAEVARHFLSEDKFRMQRIERELS